MNEGGKVVFSGRNGWVQQTSHGHRPARTTPATPGGRSRCTASTTRRTRRATTTARTRRSSASSTSPTTGASGGSAIGRARAASGRSRDRSPRRRRRNRPVDARDARAGHGRVARRAWRPITLDTSVGAGGTHRADAGPGDRAARPAGEDAHAAAQHLERDPAAAVPPGAGRGRLRRRRRPPTAARSSPRATPSRVGFGLEQVTDAAVRSELVRRMMAHLLPDRRGHHGADGQRGCGPARARR